MEYPCCRKTLLLKECGGVWLPTSQKPINSPSWWKVCFISDAYRWGKEEGGHLCKGWFPLSDSHWGKGFYRQKEGTDAETAQSVLTIIFKLIIYGLTSTILVVLGTVNLQFQVHLFPFRWGQFSELWQLMFGV